MKVTLTQENLNHGLTTVAKIAQQRGSLPILSHVLLKTINNQLFIAATNLDIAMSEVIGAKVDREGAITVPARLMQDYISSLPKGQITLELEGTNLHIKTSDKNYTSTLNGTPADDFPAMPEVASGKSFEVSSKEFVSSLSRVLFCASHDDSRPVLMGVYMHSNDKGDVYVAATDSYRLAQCKTTIKSKNPMSLIFPSAALQELLRVAKSDDEKVVITYDEQQAVFQVGSVEIVTRLIDGTYPDYQKLLPKSFTTTAEMSREDFHEVVKISSLFAREAAGGVTLHFSEDDNTLSIKSIASQVGENTATAEAKIDTDAQITMNSRYILDALTAFSGEKLNVCVNGKLDPCVLSDPSDKSYLHVIMPVKS